MTAALATLATARVSAQMQSQIRFTTENARANAYLRDLTNPRGLVGVAGGAVFERFRHDRTELGDELAYRATQRMVGVSVRHGLAAVMHVSPDHQYQLCECGGFGPRVVHALVETFTDRRDDGSRTLAVPRIAAGYAEGFTGLAWNRDRNVGSVLTGATLSLGGQALFNIFRELTRIKLPIHP
ncbi:MAG TPA: hypothetical protein VH763_19125 [Gemmatimonadales bacterium]|jgi:hypothetical protein